MTSELLFVLLRLLEREEGFPLHIRVSPDDELLTLRSQVSTLTASLEALQRDFNRTEYLYRCEAAINLRLVDVCREHGIKLPVSFFSRPY